MVLLGVFLLMAISCFADTAENIAIVGDYAWEEKIDWCDQMGIWTDLTSAEEIAYDFDEYYGKVMQFPAIDFTQFITDKSGNKYYYYGYTDGDVSNFFIIDFDPGIQDILYKLNNALGKQSGEYEVLGMIQDVDSDWDNVVFMKILAMRVKGRACIFMTSDGPQLVGQEYLDDAMAKKAASWDADIPRNAKSVPADLDAESTAKWFLYYGSTEKNEELWTNLCSKEENAVRADGSLEAKGQSWWRMISKADRNYYFVRADTDRNDATHQYFMYQIQINGSDVGAAKPMCVVKESDGSWKVSSF